MLVSYIINQQLSRKVSKKLFWGSLNVIEFFLKPLSFFFSGGKDESILKKKPQKSDVFKLLRRKSASWEDFALELQIDDNERKKLRMEVTISIELKLERVLEIWMQSETTEVTWEKIIQVLVALKSIDLAKEVKRFLQQEKHRMKIDNAGLFL